MHPLQDLLRLLNLESMTPTAQSYNQLAASIPDSMLAAPAETFIFNQQNAIIIYSYHAPSLHAEAGKLAGGVRK